MKQITLDDLRDVAEMSRVLHQILMALRRSPLQLGTTEAACWLRLHNSELSRMKLLHRRPQYLPYVHPAMLYRLLLYLCQVFPTLVLYRRKDGKPGIRLYRYYKGHRLPAAFEAGRLPPPPFRRLVRPGTTKWFLRQSG